MLEGILLPGILSGADYRGAVEGLGVAMVLCLIALCLCLIVLLSVYAVEDDYTKWGAVFVWGLASVYIIVVNLPLTYSACLMYLYVSFLLLSEV